MPTGEDKAAILLSRMPTEVVEAVLGQLHAEQSSRLRTRLHDLQKTPQPPHLLEQALVDLRDLLRKTAPPAPTPEKKADALADEYVPSAVASPGAEASRPAVDNPSAELQQLDGTLLAAALRDERTPTVALILSALPIARVGEILKLLPKDVRRDVALRLGQSASLGPDLLSAAVRGVLHKARLLASQPEHLDEDAQVKKMAELLRNLEREDRKEILDSLVLKDPGMAEKVKKLIYLFEDLLRVENRSLQSLLAELDMKTLALALRDAAESLTQKVMSNLSARGRETMEEEMSLLTSAPQSKTREAQAAVVELMQRLDRDGKLVMLE